jgi:hypothetical protein
MKKVAFEWSASLLVLLAAAPRASAEGPDAKTPAPRACRAEVVANETRCEVRWVCGRDSKVIVDKGRQKADTGFCLLNRHQGGDVHFPVRAADGNTFDVFSYVENPGSGGAGIPPEQIVVLSRGESARVLESVAIGSGATIALEESAQGSALVFTDPSTPSQAGTRCVFSASAVECAGLPALKASKRETLTIKGRIEAGSHADGFGHNVFPPRGGGTHIDNEGSCPLEKLENGNAELVLERETFADGSTIHSCKSAKKLGANDVPLGTFCGRYDLLASTAQYVERMTFRDKRTGLLWAATRGSGLGALSQPSAAANCAALAPEVGRPMRLPTVDEAIGLAGQPTFCRDLWPQGWITWTAAPPGAREALVVDVRGGTKRGPIAPNYGYGESLGFLCVQR